MMAMQTIRRFSAVWVLGLAVAMFAAGGAPEALAAPGGGGDAIGISSIEELQLIGNDTGYPLEGDYYLTQDIDASETADWNGGAGFEPIGYYDFHGLPAENDPFTGTFDGQGHVIMGLFINRPDERHVGLFSALGAGGVVENLGLEGGSVTGGNWDVGALVGTILSGGRVSGCYATGDVTGQRDRVGGLVGGSSGVVSGSHATGAVSGKGTRIGGLVGAGGTVSGCYATGDVTGEFDETEPGTAGNKVGGLVGQMSAGSLSDSYATGVVTGRRGVGGLMGVMAQTGVHRSFATGEVTGIENVGGLLGSKIFSTVSGSYAEGAVTGVENVGGLVGRNSSGSTEASYATGAVTGEDQVGGLVGLNASGGTVSESYAAGAVHGDSEVGGLVGRNDENATVSDSYSKGAVSGGTDVSGLVGLNEGTVSYSYWDTETSGREASAGGEGRTTEQMTHPHEEETTYVEWDFEGVWRQDADSIANDGYPFLQAVLPHDAPKWILSVLDPQGDGTTDPDSGTEYEHLIGDEVEVVATPSDGWDFSHWRLKGDEAGDDNMISVVSEVEGDVQELQAVFVRQEWTLEILGPDGEGTTVPGVGTDTHYVGETAQVTAVPAEDWRLSHWLLDGVDAGDDNRITVPAGEKGDASELQAVFVRQEWTLSVLEPEGVGATEPGIGDHVFDVDDAAAVLASPSGGWHFSHWLLDGEDAGDDNPITVPAGEADATHLLRAVFQETTYEVPPDPEEGLYLIVDVSDGSDADEYPFEVLDEAPEDLLTNDAYKTDKIVLRRIPAGTYLRGAPEDEVGRIVYWDIPRHEVTLTQDFYIGVFQITQAQYENVMGENPSEHQGAMRPVDSVKWLEDVRGGHWPGDPPGSGEPTHNTFIGRLRRRTPMLFDLPTEAQWEYACRAGTTTALNSGKNLEDGVECPNLAVLGRYEHNHGDGKGDYDEHHTTVGSYLPNAWGLYDMHGNVREWCLDYGFERYPEGPLTDPLGEDPGYDYSYEGSRVIRGGSWGDNAGSSRSAYRRFESISYGQNPHPSIGFRLAAAAPVETWTFVMLAPEGEGYTVPTERQRVYNLGEEVEVRATPAMGWQLDRWEVNGEHAGNESPMTIQAEEDGQTVSVQAFFTEAAMWTLEVLTPDPASTDYFIQPLPGEHPRQLGVDSFVDILLYAGWKMEGWELDGEDGGEWEVQEGHEGFDIVVLNVESPEEEGETRTVKAFMGLEQGKWGLSIEDPVGAGWPERWVEAYDVNVPADIRAAPHEGWNFSHWELCGEVTGVGQNAMRVLGEEGEIVTLRAVFDLDEGKWALSIKPPVGHGWTEPGTGIEAYDVGEAVGVEASPADVWEFSHWLLDGQTVHENPVTVPSGADGQTKTLQAVFVSLVADHTITASAGENGTIDPSGDVSVPGGASQTFTIAPAKNYEIADVLIDGGATSVMNDLVPVGDGAFNYTFTAVNADNTIEATFDEAEDVDETPLSLSLVHPVHNWNVRRHASIRVRVQDARSGVNPDTVQIQVRKAGGSWETVSEGSEEYSADGNDVIRGICRRAGDAADFLYSFQPEAGTFEYGDIVEVRAQASDVVGNESGWQEWSFAVETRTFGQNVRVDGGASPNDHAATARDSAGNVWVAWQRAPRNRNGAIFLAKLEGRGFGREIEVLPDRTADRRRPALAFAPNGDIWVAFEEYDSGLGGWAVRTARSHTTNPEGWAAGPAGAAGDFPNLGEQQRPAVAVNAGGMVHLACQARVGGVSRIVLSTLTIGANAWNAALLTDGSSNCVAPSLAIGQGGRAYVVWRDGSDGNLYGASSADWSDVVQLTEGGGAHLPSLAAEAEAVHLAWERRAGATEIRYARLDLENGQPPSPVQGANILDEKDGVADAGVPRVAVAGSGAGARVFVCWHDRRSNTPGDLDIRFAEAGASGVFGTNILVNDDTGTAAQMNPAIGTDRDGSPYIAWSDQRNAGRRSIFFAGATRRVSADAPWSVGRDGGEHTFDVSGAEHVRQVTVVVPKDVFLVDEDLTAGEVGAPPVEAPGGLGLYFHVTPGAGGELPDWITVTIHNVPPELVPSPLRMYRFVPPPDAIPGEWTREWIRNESYNPATGDLTFDTKHLSTFGVGREARISSGGGSCSMVGGGPGDVLLLLVPYAALAILGLRLFRRRRIV